MGLEVFQSSSDVKYRLCSSANNSDRSGRKLQEIGRNVKRVRRISMHPANAAGRKCRDTQ